MEIVRPIDQYPWPAIGSWVCVLLPLCTVLYFFPAWNGDWNPLSIDIWIRITLYISAQCLPYYRWIALRGEASAERTFQQILAVSFPAIASFAQWDVARLQADGESTVDLLVHDKGAIVSFAVVVTSLASIVFCRRDRRLVTRSTT